MSNIIEKILSHQNVNHCRIYVSAVTANSAVYDPSGKVTEVTIRYVGDHKNALSKVNELLFNEGFYLDSADTTQNEYTFTRAKVKS